METILLDSALCASLRGLAALVGGIGPPPPLRELKGRSCFSGSRRAVEDDLAAMVQRPFNVECQVVWSYRRRCSGWNARCLSDLLVEVIRDPSHSRGRPLLNGFDCSSRCIVPPHADGMAVLTQIGSPCIA